MPRASISRAPAAGARFRPISAMVPLRMRTSVSKRASAVTTRPLRMMSSGGACAATCTANPTATQRISVALRPFDRIPLDDIISILYPFVARRAYNLKRIPACNWRAPNRLPLVVWYWPKLVIGTMQVLACVAGQPDDPGDTYLYAL